MLINNHDIELPASGRVNILVKDTYLEISERPTTIAFQKEPGKAPVPVAANAMFYSWNPDSILEIITGDKFEIYWLFGYDRTVTAFDDTTLPDVNQSLVRKLYYGADNEVTFNDRQQQFAVLANNGSTVKPAEVQHLVNLEYLDFDGTYFFELPVKDASGSRNTVTVKADANSGNIYGTFEPNIYTHTLSTGPAGPGNFLFYLYPGNPGTPQVNSLTYGYEKYTYQETVDWNTADEQVRYLKQVTREDGHVIYSSSMQPGMLSTYENRNNMILGGTKNYATGETQTGQFRFYGYEYTFNDYDNDYSIRFWATPATMDGQPVLVANAIENGNRWQSIVYPTYVPQTLNEEVEE